MAVQSAPVPGLAAGVVAQLVNTICWGSEFDQHSQCDHYNTLKIPMALTDDPAQLVRLALIFES